MTDLSNCRRVNVCFFVFGRFCNPTAMTKSEITWESDLDNERASSIARRFALEDLALKYRTSLLTAEKLLAKGVVVGRQARPEYPDVIEVDDSSNETKVKLDDDRHKYAKVFVDEEMDVDVEGLETSQELKSAKREMMEVQQTRSATNDYNRSQSFDSSPRSLPRQSFVFPTKSKSTNHVAAFHRHTFPNPRFLSHTWPYCVTYPYLTPNGAVLRGHPILYATANSRTMPRYSPSETLRNRYRLATSAKEHTKPSERTRVFMPPEQRPWGFTSPEEVPRGFSPTEDRPRELIQQKERPQRSTPPDERPRGFTPPEERPWVFPLVEKSRALTIDEEKRQLFNSLEERPLVKSQQPEKRRRSYTLPLPGEYTTEHPKSNAIVPRCRSNDALPSDCCTEHPKSCTVKPRRHSDDTITNYSRPSVLVMQRSLSSSSETTENSTWNDDHQLTDSDSSATPPPTQAGTSSSSESNKGKIRGKFQEFNTKGSAKKLRL